jgi:NAD(P)-dependent dehydrogenase (short-subunit alcohol dehydrogenase family)
MPIVVVGAGPNVGAAIARRFGLEGVPVGLSHNNRTSGEDAGACELPLASWRRAEALSLLPDRKSSLRLPRPPR